jgi:hypothetical protein
MPGWHQAWCQAPVGRRQLRYGGDRSVSGIFQQHRRIRWVTPAKKVCGITPKGQLRALRGAFTPELRYEL